MAAGSAQSPAKARHLSRLGWCRAVGGLRGLSPVVGFDVLMAYNLVNGVQARQAVNAAGGVMPP